MCVVSATAAELLAPGPITCVLSRFTSSKVAILANEARPLSVIRVSSRLRYRNLGKTARYCNVRSLIRVLERSIRSTALRYPSVTRSLS